MFFWLIALYGCSSQEVELELEVRKRTIKVHCLDDQGQPIRGLGRSDFDLRVGRDQQVIEHVIESGTWRVEQRLNQASERHQVVLLFQCDLSGIRNADLLRSCKLAREQIVHMQPRDYVAVVSFKAKLRLHCDFSQNRERIDQAINAVVGQGQVDPEAESCPISLAWDPDRADEQTTIEKALTELARCLTPLPGSKSVFFLGWGVGEFSPNGIRFSPAYDEARAALRRANTSVFALDYSDADFHTLEEGLKRIAGDSGGSYSRLKEHAKLGWQRAWLASSHHYLIVFDEPDCQTRCKVRLRLNRPHKELYYPRTIDIEP